MKFFLSFFLLVSCYLSCTHAQQSDFGIWTGISIKKKINSTFSADFSQQINTRENSTRTDKFFSQIGLGYKISDYLKLNISYRFSQIQNMDVSYKYANRLQSDLTFFYKLKNFKLSYRMRLQNQYEEINTSENGKTPITVFRQKANVELDYGRRITPGFSAEYFYGVKSFLPSNLSSERYRATLNYDINNKNKVQVFYQFQNKWNVKLPVNSYIIGLMYGFDL